MRKWLLIPGWLMMSATPALACTTCGCSGGGTTLGMQLVNVRNYSGLIWQHTGLTVLEQGELHSSFLSDTWQLYGSLQLPGKWHIQTRLPMVWNRVAEYTAEGNHSTELFAAGDLSLLAGFQAFSLNRGPILHTLFLQAGAELPTGKYEADFVQQGLPPGFFPGSASVDPIAGFQYVLNDSAWTFMMAASMKYSTRNADHFQEGWSGQAQVVAARSIGKSGSWVPFAGVTTEHRSGYRKFDFVNEESAFFVFQALAGLEYRADRCSIGGRYDHTVWQRYSTPEMTNPGAISAYFNWYF